MNHANEPHDHHFSPQGFLKQWSTGDGKIWRTKIISHTGAVETRLQNSTKSVAWKKDLYNIDRKFRTSPIIRFAVEFIKARHQFNGELSLNLETSVFQKVDDDGISSYRKVLSAADFKALSPLELSNFFRFTYLLQARNPINLERMASSWTENVLPQFTGKLQGTAYDVHDVTADGNSGKLALLDIALNLEIGKELYDKVALFFITLENGEASFVTTDYPYVAMPDIGNERALHLMPLSPKLCLLMSPNADMIQRFASSFKKPGKAAEIASFVNFVMCAYASEVFSQTNDVPQEIGDYLGLYARNRERARSILSNKMAATL